MEAFGEVSGQQFLEALVINPLEASYRRNLQEAEAELNRARKHEVEI